MDESHSQLSFCGTEIVSLNNVGSLFENRISVSILLTDKKTEKAGKEQQQKKEDG